MSLSVSATSADLLVGTNVIKLDNVRLAPEPADDTPAGTAAKEVLWLNDNDFLSCDLPYAYDTGEIAYGGFFAQLMWDITFNVNGQLDGVLMLDDPADAERIAAAVGHAGWPALVAKRDIGLLRKRQLTEAGG